MYMKQVIIFSVVVFVISTPDIISGYEIISTTTERDVTKDDKCQQEIIKTLKNNLQEQQNFWISFYNDSCELPQTRKEQLFDKKLEEAKAEYGKKQKELMQHFDKKVEEIDAKYANIQQGLKQIENKLEVNAEFGKKQRELVEIVNEQNNLLQQFDQKMGKLEAKFANVQEVFEQFKKEIENITSNLGKLEHEKIISPKNCMEILKRGIILSDVYTIQPSGHSPSVEVRCDMYTKGGGWTYVLNRFDGSQDFYLDWQHYRDGFGNLSGEFWLGLEHLYELTDSQDNQLLIEIVDWDNKHFHAMYDVFRIGSEEEGYPIKVLDGYSGDAGDCLTYHKDMKFTTRDRDQDKYFENCAILKHGAWWYKSCAFSSLAGTYFHTPKDDQNGIFWYRLKQNYVSLKKVKMMVRPYYLY